MTRSVSGHPDTSAGDKATLAGDTRAGEVEPAGGTAAPLEPGTRIGRYVVTALRGAGSMGIVYSAYDQDLDRKIALKLIHPDRSSSPKAQDRLLHEAKALAQVNHANVITVHHVGTYESQVFVAMDFIEGQTLTEWLRAEPRGWRAVVARFLAAGRGLGAAHEAGLVHGDFKPDNVLVADDGRILVTDFGLAISSEGADEASGTAPSRPHEGRTLAALAGTPAYMAPELHRGERRHERSDQFAFCVALFEGLHGIRPFHGDTLAALSLAISQGHSRDAPRDAAVPMSVQKVVRRGLSVDPRDRYPSMRGLLRDLARDSGARRRRALLVAAGAIAVGAALWPRPSPICTGAEQQIATVWGPPHRRAVASAFSSIDKPYADAAQSGVEGILDQYASAWASMHVESCEATHGDGGQSGAVLDLRMSCLRRRKEELHALVEVFEAPDAKVVEKAVAAASNLTPIAVCSDVAQLDAVAPTPEDPELRRRVEAIEKQLAEVRAQIAAGLGREGLALSRRVAEEASAIGHAPTTAEALFLLGYLQSKNDELDGAQRSLDEAFQEAARGSHDAVAARAAIRMTFVVGYKQGRRDEAFAWARAAEAAVHRVGNPDDLRAKLLNSNAILYETFGDYEAAERTYREAVVLDQRVRGPDDVGATLSSSNLAALLLARHRFDEAHRLYEAALGAKVRLLGPDHPVVGQALNAIGALHYERLDLDEAERIWTRALSIREAAVGPEHPSLAHELNNLGNVYRTRSELGKAAVFYERALAISEPALGLQNHLLANFLNNLGGVRTMQERYAESRALLERGLALRESALGADHPAVASSLTNLGGLAASEEKFAEAVRLLERALAISEPALGPQHRRVAAVLHGLGEARLRSGEPQIAAHLLDRALASYDRTAPAPDILAVTQFLRARASWAVRGGDRARGHALAVQARDAYSELGEGYEDSRAEVDGWLATHRVD